MVNRIEKNKIRGGFFIPLLAFNLHKKILEGWVRQRWLIHILFGMLDFSNPWVALEILKDFATPVGSM